jgi:hypothetical protein
MLAREGRFPREKATWRRAGATRSRLWRYIAIWLQGDKVGQLWLGRTGRVLTTQFGVATNPTRDVALISAET